MMNNFNMSDTRNRRNLLNWTGIFPFHTVANYSTDSSKIKMEIKNSFGENLYINNLHLIPDPLKKNLADSVVTGEVKTKTNMASETKTFVNEPRMKDCTSGSENRADSMGGITSFLSGVFSFVSGAMFHKRENSSTQYYDCYEQNYDEQAPSLQAWHIAKPEVQNKNGRAHNVIVSTDETPGNDHVTVNFNAVTAASCENKLKEVCLLLQNQHSQYQSQFKSEDANKVKEPSVLEDCYEDAFCCDGFNSLQDKDFFEYYGPFSHQNSEFLMSDSPKITKEIMPLAENMEITKILPDINDVKPHLDKSDPDLNDSNKNKLQIVTTCEDKMSKLKELLQEKCKNKFKCPVTSDDNLETLKDKKQQFSIAEPISIPSSNKTNSTDSNVHCITNVFSNYCNENGPNNHLESQSTIDDLECSDTSAYLDPCNYFDEVTGKFYSTSVDSEDSFQIVFADSPRSCRGRLPSDCDSEDSFIVFDDSPDSCYLSNDIFGEDIDVEDVKSEISSDSSDSESYDSNSDSDSDCLAFNKTCKLSHTLTKTIGDLTDDSLYDLDGDEVDCATVFAREKSVENAPNAAQTDECTQSTSPNYKGPLIDENRKLEETKQPKKTVRFSDKPPKVHVMRVWAFAARQARAGHWERHALDRERFKRRIADVEMAVSWVLKPQHRSRIMFQRFMPWWNAEKRRELAEREANNNDNKAEVRDTPNKTTGEQDSETGLETNEKTEENNRDVTPNEDYKNCIITKRNGFRNVEVGEGKKCNGIKIPNGIRRNSQVSAVGSDIVCPTFNQHDDVHVST